MILVSFAGLLPAPVNPITNEGLPSPSDFDGHVVVLRIMVASMTFAHAVYLESSTRDQATDWARKRGEELGISQAVVWETYHRPTKSRSWWSTVRVSN